MLSPLELHHKTGPLFFKILEHINQRLFQRVDLLSHKQEALVQFQLKGCNSILYLAINCFLQTFDLA